MRLIAIKVFFPKYLKKNYVILTYFFWQHVEVVSFLIHLDNEKKMNDKNTLQFRKTDNKIDKSNYQRNECECDRYHK